MSDRYIIRDTVNSGCPTQGRTAGFSHADGAAAVTYVSPMPALSAAGQIFRKENMLVPGDDAATDVTRKYSGIIRKEMRLTIDIEVFIF